MAKKRKYKAKKNNRAFEKVAKDLSDIRMNKHEITDEIISCLADNMITTKEVNEICFAVMYHTLLSKDNMEVMKKNFGIDILQLSGNELVDFVHTINKTLIQLKDDFSNIHQIVGE